MSLVGSKKRTYCQQTGRSRERCVGQNAGRVAAAKDFGPAALLVGLSSRRRGLGKAKAENPRYPKEAPGIFTAGPKFRNIFLGVVGRRYLFVFLSEFWSPRDSQNLVRTPRYSPSCCSNQAWIRGRGSCGRQNREVRALASPGAGGSNFAKRRAHLRRLSTRGQTGGGGGLDLGVTA